MFVRKKYDKNKNRWRVQIVHNQRDGKLVRQKIIRHVGTADSEAQLAQLMIFANIILEQIKQHSNPQRELFTPKQYVDLLGTTPIM